MVAVARIYVEFFCDVATAVHGYVVDAYGGVDIIRCGEDDICQVGVHAGDDSDDRCDGHWFFKVFRFSRLAPSLGWGVVRVAVRFFVLSVFHLSPQSRRIVFWVDVGGCPCVDLEGVCVISCSREVSGFCSVRGPFFWRGSGWRISVPVGVHFVPDFVEGWVLLVVFPCRLGFSRLYGLFSYGGLCGLWVGGRLVDARGVPFALVVSRSRLVRRLCIGWAILCVWSAAWRFVVVLCFCDTDVCRYGSIPRGALAEVL